MCVCLIAYVISLGRRGREYGNYDHSEKTLIRTISYFSSYLMLHFNKMIRVMMENIRVIWRLRTLEQETNKSPAELWKFLNLLTRTVLLVSGNSCSEHFALLPSPSFVSWGDCYRFVFSSPPTPVFSLFSHLILRFWQ